MATKWSPPVRKITWTLPTRKPTLPPLQESHAEEEDYPSFESQGGPVKRSLFAKIFSIKPLTRVIQTTIPGDGLYAELVELLRRWEGLGIGIGQITEHHTKIIRAKLQSHNSVGLKALRFRIQITAIGTASSNAVFTQEKGNQPPPRLHRIWARCG
jgi:hypothetical protein